MKLLEHNGSKWKQSQMLVNKKTFVNGCSCALVKETSNRFHLYWIVVKVDRKMPVKLKVAWFPIKSKPTTL